MKKYLKKSLSVFMALLMVLSTLFVIVPEFALKAEAAAPSSYDVVIYHTVGNACDGDCTATIYYKPNNGNGTETNTGAKNLTGAKDGSAAASTSFPGISGWPSKILISMKTPAFNDTDVTVTKITINGTTVWEGSAPFAPGWGQTRTKTFYPTNDAGTAGSVDKNGGTDASTTTWSWPKPVINKVTWDDATQTALTKSTTVPYAGTATVATPTASAYDNYGVKWYDSNVMNFALSTSSEVTTATDIATNSGITVSDKGSYGQLNVTNAAKAYLAANSWSQDEQDSGFENDHALPVYITAYYGSYMVSQPMEITVTNCLYDVNFENLFSFSEWAHTTAFGSTTGVKFDQANGKVTLTNNASSGEVTTGIQYQIPVTAGKTYTLQYTRGEDLDTDVYVFYNGSTSANFSDAGNRLSTATKGTVSKDFTVPSGVTYVTLRFDANTPGETYSFSDILFYEKSSREGVTLNTDRMTVYGNEQIGVMPTPTKTGYKFDGWYTSAGVQYATGIAISDFTHLFAKWSPIKNNANFYDYDGQLYATVQGDYGTAISNAAPSAPASFTNEYGTYVFYRWVNKETGEALGSEIFDCPNETDIVAEYQAEYKRTGSTVSYTTNFYNEGTLFGSVSGYFNQSVGVPADIPAKAPEQIDGVDAYEYVFTGWGDADGNVIIPVGESYRITDNETYYACYDKVLAQHTITTVYGTNSGEDTGKGEYTEGYGNWVELVSPADWRDSTYTNKFSYWTDSKGNVITPAANQKSVMVQVLGPETYTAHYTQTAIEYHAWFYNEGEMFADHVYSNGDTVVLPEKAPEKGREGNTTYDFVGWFTKDADGNWGTQFVEGTTIAGNDQTYYAKYEEVKWSHIAFYIDNGDGSYTMIKDSEAEYVWGSEITAPAAPEKESTAQYDYEFSGWTAYPGETFIPAGDVITTPEVDTNYVATYAPTVRQYTVTFTDENGELLSEGSFDYGTVPVAPTAPEKATTERYTYTFDGWYDGNRSYDADKLPEVTGDVTYKAIYKATDIIYKVHWLTPTTPDATAFTDNTVNYLYNRIISMPATTPVCENTETKEGYTWGFAGWFAADANGNLLKDEEGNTIPYAKGTHITSEVYYVAVFDFIPNAHTVKVYAEDGTTLLGEYVTGYGLDVIIPAYEKDAVKNGHYVLVKLVDLADGTTVVGTTDEDGTTTINVKSDLSLKVVYELKAHTYPTTENGATDWVIDEEADYQYEGSKHAICTVCRYRLDEKIPVLVDKTAPIGQIVIGGNNWNTTENYTSTAYVRADAIVSLLTSDVGVGIKSIEYRWSDGTTGTYEVADKFDTAVNYNFPIPSDFAGKYLSVTVTDYQGYEFYMDSAILQLDNVDPTIAIYNGCTLFGFMVYDDHELGAVKVTDPDGNEISCAPYEDEEGNIVEDENGAIAYLIGDETGATALAAGKYTIEVTDKAGNSSKETIVVAGEHTESDWIIDVEADCENAGSKHTECTACGVELKEEEIAKLGHDLGAFVVDVEPTCEEEGSESMHCSRCDYTSDSRPVAALGHDYIETVTEPTCEEGGYTTVTCSRCDYEETKNATTALGHAWVAGETTEATCTAGGWTDYTCSTCGATKKDYLTQPIEHNFVETVIESECSENSISKFVCSACGETYFVGELTGHVWETIETVAPKCTEDGYHVDKCKNCDAEITIVDRLSRLGHKWNADYTTDTEATCTTAGSKSIHCSVCDAKKNVTEIPATGHNLVVNEEKSYDATCANDGYELKECSACEYTEEKIIPATGKHSYTKNDEKTTTSTCETAGKEVWECDCGDSYTKDLPLADHTKGEVVATVDGTCQTKASTTYKCSVCETEFTVEGEYGTHEASDTLVKTLKAATCTKPGDGVYKCKHCDATVVVTGGIKATGHSYKGKVTAPTCTEGGYTTYTCENCGDTYIADTTDPAGHKWETDFTVDVEATCEKNGSKSIHCSVCGEKKDVTVIPATGSHTSSDWIVDKKATCTEDGSQHKECTVCGETLETEVIANKGGHTQGALVRTETPATCCLDGKGVYKCTTCGETYYDAIPADGESHSYTTWTTQSEASCTVDGVKVKTCTNKDASGKTCGHSVEKITPASGHNHKITKEEIVEVGGNFVTRYTYTCSRCGNSYTKDVETSAYLVTIINNVEGTTSTIILEDGDKLSKYDLPAITPVEVDGFDVTVKWTYADGTEVKFPVEITDNSTVIYADAVYTETTYTITFVNRLGKVISEAEYKLGATVTAPVDQVAAGYTFLGWSDGTTTYAAEAIPAVTGDATYFADFKANEGVKTYYVTYKNDTGSKTVFTQIVETGNATTAPELTPTKTTNTVYHYVFAGWVDADGNAYDFTTKITSNVTLYAKFNAVKHSESCSSTTSPATCSKAEETVNVCNGCGYEWVTYTNPATGHTYKETGRTTTADGQVIVTYKCSVCGDEWTKTVTQGMADSNAITVTVTDTSGNPVEGASVAIYLGDLKVTTAVTNAKGKAYFAKDVVADGSYRVNVSKDGYDDLSGTLIVKDGKGTVKLSSFSITECHCVCHANSFFGNIRRWFTNLLRSIFKDYTCCDCGNMGHIY